MANRSRTRKRVHAIIPCRAPDGSAFQNCNLCGEMVAIALADMHDCGTEKKELKRFKGIPGTQNTVKPKVTWQSRSPFNIFMERFKESNKNENLIDIDQKGFETWKNMSHEERKPYIAEAEKVNSAYEKDVIEEEKYTTKVDDDEADSAMVGKFDQSYDYCECSETSDDECYESGGIESLNTTEWEMQQSETAEHCKGVCSS